jgi:hypothetical protein
LTLSGIRRSPAPLTEDLPGVFSFRVSSELYNGFEIDHWNKCLTLLIRPLEELDEVQRPAALVFNYYGRVMNGGHSLHFDGPDASRSEEILAALKLLGANQHARILAEARFLKREADEADEDMIEGERDYASGSIADLDMQYGRLKPEIPDFLAQYFKAHPEHFPK